MPLIPVAFAGADRHENRGRARPDRDGASAVGGGAKGADGKGGGAKGKGAKLAPKGHAGGHAGGGGKKH